MSSDRSTPNNTQGLRVNDQIRISPLRVVDGNGNMLGIISRDKALEIAREQELDLVEVAPLERPPVCKMMDYGKFKYEQTRKIRKANKQHHTQLKEIRVRPGCGDHDLDVKLKHAREFLDNKDKVQITVQFKGREMAHTEVGLVLVRDMVEKLSDVGKVERVPMREGRKIIAIIAPK
ncbi:MAG: translation initiation factor IF-3 [Planctomycetota bacterium]